MSTVYGKSPGGFLWAIAEPVGAIAILTFALSFVLIAPPLGRDFALFYATGFIPFFAYLDISNKVGSALRFSRPLMGFAGIGWLDVLAARFALNLLTQMLVGAVVIGAIVLWIDGLPPPDAARIARAGAMTAALALGIGTVNAYLTGAFPVWERAWAVVMRPMFLISGVVFLLEDAPRSLQPILAWNPLFHITGEMRAAFYPTYHPHYVSPVYVFGLALILLVVGACLLHRHQDELAAR